MSNQDFALKLARSIENEIIKSTALAELACIYRDDEILREALKIAEKMDLLHYSETLSKISVVMAKAKRFDEAIDFANNIVEERFRLEALETITFHLCDACEFDKALEIAKKLRYRSQRALSNLAIKLAIVNEFDKSIAIAKNIREKSWKAETLAKIGFFDLENRDKLFKESLNVANSIEDIAIKSRTLLKIAFEMAKAKLDFERTLKEGLDYEKNDMDLLTTSLKFAEIGKLDKALEIIDKIKSKSFKAEALAKIANITNKDLFKDALSVAEEIKDLQILLETLSKIAVEMAKSAKNYRALDEVVEKLNVLDGFEKSKILANIIIDIVELDIKKAIELSSSITDEVYMSEALFYITSKLAEIKEFDEALSITDKIVVSYWKSKALAKIAIELAKIYPSS